jgi:hypothetical protein
VFSKKPLMSAPAVNLFHVFGVAPALAYVFYQNYNGRALEKSAATVGLVVIALVALYHGYLFYTKSVTPTGVTDSRVGSNGGNGNVDAGDFTHGAKVNGGTDSAGMVDSGGMASGGAATTMRRSAY